MDSRGQTGPARDAFCWFTVAGTGAVQLETRSAGSQWREQTGPAGDAFCWFTVAGTDAVQLETRSAGSQVGQIELVPLDKASSPVYYSVHLLLLALPCAANKCGDLMRRL